MTTDDDFFAGFEKPSLVIPNPRKENEYLRARLSTLVGLLRRVEWDDMWCCPICGGDSPEGDDGDGNPGAGHHAGCDLAAALKEGTP